MKVGYIGTGHMGNPMAGHLIDHGHELVVHDARPAAARNLIARGASWADSPAAIAETSILSVKRTTWKPSCSMPIEGGSRR